jgi:hypothetical protein
LPSSVGILGEALHQDLARAVERGLGVGTPCFRRLGREVLRRLGLRAQRRVGQQASASGSSPASRAICALVRRFCL